MRVPGSEKTLKELYYKLKSYFRNNIKQLMVIVLCPHHPSHGDHVSKKAKADRGLKKEQNDNLPQGLRSMFLVIEGGFFVFCDSRLSGSVL